MILVTGKGKSGSWAIRGCQLGAAIGATVIPNASESDIRRSDLVVLVKRPTDEILAYCRKHSRPIVWDVVDAWPQPHGNDWDRDICMDWLRSQVFAIKPRAIVAATQKMADDCSHFGVPVLWLPHHHRPGIERNPIRERIEVVGYEGGEAYIHKWKRYISVACDNIGARFVVNPQRLADVDVVLALRDARGYAPRNWKSGCKSENAKGSGTPIIACREAGYLELSCGAEYWADSSSELSTALAWLSSHEARLEVSCRLFASRISVDAAARRMNEWMSKIQR